MAGVPQLELRLWGMGWALFVIYRVGVKQVLVMAPSGGRRFRLSAQTWAAEPGLRPGVVCIWGAARVPSAEAQDLYEKEPFVSDGLGLSYRILILLSVRWLCLSPTLPNVTTIPESKDEEAFY